MSTDVASEPAGDSAGSGTRSRPRPVLRWVLGALLVVQVALVVLVTNRWHFYRPVITVQCVAFAVSLLVLVVLRDMRISRHDMAKLLLIGCAVMQLAAILGPPTTSDDDYRYVWDATVQLSGTDPYRYTPADPVLAPLRSAFTFPAENPCTHNVVPGGCTRINRPTVHTIYPPVAQVAFVLARLVSFGGHGNHLPLQVLAGLGVLLSTWLLIRLADARGSPLWHVAVWALSPVVAIEATSNAHIEWLAVLFSVSSLVLLRGGRSLGAGFALGAAIATKLYPGVLLTTVGRRGWKAIAGAVGLVAVSYLPHVLAVGPEVIGYLPQYLKEESYGNGGRYVVVTWLVGQHAASTVAPLLLAAGLVWLWWRADPRSPEHTAVAAAGLYLLVTTPNYGWYALILIAMIAASGRLEWLWLAFAPGLQYMSAEVYWNPHTVSAYGFGVATVIVLAVSIGRWLTRRRGRGPAAGATVATGLPSLR